MWHAEPSLQKIGEDFTFPHRRVKYCLVCATPVLVFAKAARSNVRLALTSVRDVHARRLVFTVREPVLELYDCLAIGILSMLMLRTGAHMGNVG